MPNVSVIIPNYNHHQYLRKRIETVLNQSYQDLEVIILDDCSTDNSRMIIEEYRGNEKVRAIVYNEENSGSTFLQWKKGIDLANGKYIWIAESDDFAALNLLETLIKPFSHHLDLVISYCRSYMVDENDKVTGLELWADALHATKWTKDYVENGLVEIRRFLRYRNTIPNASAVLFKKPQYLEEVLKTDMRFTGDWLFLEEPFKRKN